MDVSLKNVTFLYPKELVLPLMLASAADAALACCPSFSPQTATGYHQPFCLSTLHAKMAMSSISTEFAHKTSTFRISILLQKF